MTQGARRVALLVVVVAGTGGVELIGADSAGGIDVGVPPVEVPPVEVPKLPTTTPSLSPVTRPQSTAEQATGTAQTATGTVETAVGGSRNGAAAGSTSTSAASSPSSAAAIASGAPSTGEPATTAGAASTVGRSASTTSAPTASDRRQARRRFERRLRAVVRRLDGCMYALPVLEQKVLWLRAGLETGRPLSRRAAATRLDTSIRRVRRAEVRGLRGLRAANRRSGCGSFRAPARRALELAAAPSPRLVAVNRLAPPETGARAQPRSNKATGSGGLLAARGSGGKLATPGAAPPLSPASADGGVRLVPVFIGLLVLVLLAVLATWSLMRRRGAIVRQAEVASPSLPPPPPAPELEPESAPEPPEPQEIAPAAEQDQTSPPGGGRGWWEESEQASKPTGRYTRRSGGLLGPRATSVILGLAERLRRRR